MDETAHASTVNVSSKETDQYVQAALVQVRYGQGEVCNNGFATTVWHVCPFLLLSLNFHSHVIVFA